MIKQVTHSLHHIVIFSNAEKKFLTRVNQDILFNYIRTMLNSKHCHTHIINGFGNHIHIAVEISADIALQKLVKEIQINTTDFIRRENSVFPEFHGWNLCYIALSYHVGQLNELKNFISEQYIFHKNCSFDDEIKYLIGETENIKA